MAEIADITFDDIFRQTNFYGSLPYIPQIKTSTNNDIFLNDLATDLPSTMTTSQVEELFAGFIKQRLSQSGTINIHKLSDFFKDWNQWVHQYADPSSDSNVGLYTGLIGDMNNDLGTTISISGSASTPPLTSPSQVSGDWAILMENSSTSLAPPLDFNYQTQDERVPVGDDSTYGQLFRVFLTNTTFTVPVVSGSFPQGYADPAFFESFMDGLHRYFTASALFQNSSQSTDPAAFDGVVSMEDIYTAFGPPNATHDDFLERLKQFYNEKYPAGQYFLPSQFVSDWMKTIQAENGTSILVDTGQSSLSGNDSYKVQVIDRVLLLIIDMISTLQGVAVAQANRLTYETDFQNVYTALQTQVPVYLQGDGSGIDGSSTSDQNARNDINSSYNGIIIDNLRSFRSIHENNAKQIQSYINTTNDAVNQQTDMATSFLQELNTLLTTIFR